MIVITGAAGFVGRDLAPELARDGAGAVAGAKGQQRSRTDQ